jgi:hypothetical protein
MLVMALVMALLIVAPRPHQFEFVENNLSIRNINSMKYQQHGGLNMTDDN